MRQTHISRAMSKRLANRVDLNLLELFVETYRLRNLTQAGQQLGLSQSAMSRALARLRDAYRDALFVRMPYGLAPTPLADSLYASASAALEIVSRSLEAPTFDAETSTRVFRIAMSDTGEQVFLPPLARAISKLAPGVRIETMPSDATQLPTQLASGTTDLGIGYFAPNGQGVLQQTLFTAQYACIARNDHPLIGDTLTLGQFRQLDHVVVTFPSTAHTNVITRVLASPDIQAKIALNIASFLSIGRIVSQTDYIATIPRTLAESFESAWSVRSFPPPLELGTYEVVQCWHERFDREPGLVWLRRLTERLLRTVLK